MLYLAGKRSTVARSESLGSRLHFEATPELRKLSVCSIPCPNTNNRYFSAQGGLPSESK